jgi:hypothetical protein
MLGPSRDQPRAGLLGRHAIDNHQLEGNPMDIRLDYTNMLPGGAEAFSLAGFSFTRNDVESCFL